MHAPAPLWPMIRTLQGRFGDLLHVAPIPVPPDTPSSFTQGPHKAFLNRFCLRTSAKFFVYMHDGIRGIVMLNPNIFKPPHRTCTTILISFNIFSFICCYSRLKQIWRPLLLFTLLPTRTEDRLTYWVTPPCIWVTQIKSRSGLFTFAIHIRSAIHGIGYTNVHTFFVHIFRGFVLTFCNSNDKTY